MAKNMKQKRPIKDHITGYKERDLFKTNLFKMAVKTFGPPKSRCRVIIAPPMEKMDSKAVSALEAAQQSRKEVTVPRTWIQSEQESAQKPVNEEEELLSWIAERKAFRAQLDSFGDLRKWLQKKPSLTEMEAAVLEQLKRLYREGPLPAIAATRLIQARIPTTDVKVADLVSLSSSESDFLSYKDSAVGHKMWQFETREERKRETQRMLESGVDDIRPIMDVQAKMLDDGAGPVSASSPLSPVPLELHSSESSLSKYSEVHPISLEGRSLTYEDMMDIGKAYQERRRKTKSNTQLLEWLEQCWVLQTGISAIDRNCFPSTLGGDTWEAIDRFRKRCFFEYLNVLHLCQQYGVRLSEKLLQKALLYPGDKLPYAPKQLMKTRRSGAPFSFSSSFTSAGLHPPYDSKMLLKIRKYGTPFSLSRKMGTTRLPSLSDLDQLMFAQPKTSSTPSTSHTPSALYSPDDSQYLKTKQAGARLPSRKSAENRRMVGSHLAPASAPEKKPRLPYPSRDYVNWMKKKVRRRPMIWNKKRLDCWISFEEFEGMIKSVSLLNLVYQHSCAILLFSHVGKKEIWAH